MAKKWVLGKNWILTWGFVASAECCDERACVKRCFHGECRAPDERAPGPWCNCLPGFSGETCQTPLAPQSHSKSAPAVSTVWQIACFVVTACGSASLLAIVPHFRRTLRSLRRLKLPEDDREQGVGGLLLFCGGVIDFGLSLWACCGLFACEGLEHSAVLALSFLAALVVNFAATAGFALLALNTIREASAQGHGPLLQDSEDLDAWSATTNSSTTRVALRYRKRLPLLALGSIARFQSLAMLRFRLCGHKVMEYPMDDKHMFFLRNAVRLLSSLPARARRRRC